MNPQRQAKELILARGQWAHPNNGSGLLQITGVTTSGTGAAYFSVNGMPGTVGAGGGVSNFTVIFSPIVAGVRTAVVAIANNSTNTSYRVNFRGQSSGQISLSTTSLIFTGTYNGSNPESQNLEIRNLSLVSLNYVNVIQYGSGADGWLSIFPASGSIAGSGYQATLASVDITGLNAGVLRLQRLRTDPPTRQIVFHSQ